MAKVARGPHAPNNPQEYQLGSPRPRLGSRIVRIPGETAGEVLLHEGELGGEVESGGDRVELDEGDEMGLEGGDEGEGGGWAGGEQEDQVDKDT
jgi:hypothetical protein